MAQTPTVRKKPALFLEVPPERVLIPRYIFRDGDQVRGPFALETLSAYSGSGELTVSTLIAAEASNDFRPAQEWEFAHILFPEKAKLTLYSYPPPKTLAVTSPKPLSPAVQGSSEPLRHMTSIQEMRARVAQDPNDPLVLVTLARVNDAAKREGLTPRQALGRFFADNEGLNRRLRVRVIYKAVNELIRTYRTSAIIAAVGLNTLFLYQATSSIGIDRQAALWAFTFTNSILTLVYTFAFRINHWLEIHPVRAGFLFMAFFYVLGTAIFAGIANSVVFYTESYSTVFWRVLTGY